MKTIQEDCKRDLEMSRTTSNKESLVEEYIKKHLGSKELHHYTVKRFQKFRANNRTYILVR